VGEDILQRWIIELLRPLLQRWLDDRHVVAFVGADQFVYWKQHDPHKRVGPTSTCSGRRADDARPLVEDVGDRHRAELQPRDRLERLEKDYSEGPPLHEAAGWASW